MGSPQPTERNCFNEMGPVTADLAVNRQGHYRLANRFMPSRHVEHC